MMYIGVKTIHSPNVGVMIVQRLRRWTIITPTWDSVFSGSIPVLVHWACPTMDGEE